MKLIKSVLLMSILMFINQLIIIISHQITGSDNFYIDRLNVITFILGMIFVRFDDYISK